MANINWDAKFTEAAEKLTIKLTEREARLCKMALNRRLGTPVYGTMQVFHVSNGAWLVDVQAVVNAFPAIDKQTGIQNGDFSDPWNAHSRRKIWYLIIHTRLEGYHREDNPFIPTYLRKPQQREHMKVISYIDFHLSGYGANFYTLTDGINTFTPELLESKKGIGYRVRLRAPQPIAAMEVSNLEPKALFSLS